MKRIIAAAAALTFVGCASSVTKLQGPSGGPAYLVKCGAARIELCYEEAAKACPKGYALADKTESGAAGAFAPTGNMALAIRGPHSMLVECRM